MTDRRRIPPAPAVSAAEVHHVGRRIAVGRAALSHRSASSRNNERLEFLGDSVLNLVVAEQLFRLYPTASEGDLSRLRARVVSAETRADAEAQGRALRRAAAAVAGIDVLGPAEAPLALIAEDADDLQVICSVSAARTA